MKKNEALVALRKVNIKTWKSPVAKQFKIGSIPYFVITDASGKIIDKGNSSLFHKYKKILGK